MSGDENGAKPSLGAGQKLGRYEILRPLASGGMGELYLARATGAEGFERLVALKRLLPRVAADGEAVELFLGEARLTAALHHPNVAHVYDMGTSDHGYFFAMEYVRGQDLRSILRKAKEIGRGLSIANALAIVRGVAAGLHSAHEGKDKHGQPLFAAHRDITPSNVMITYEGAVKIVDFGVARAALREKREGPSSVRGTVAYMSPEQFRGEELDRRSDVFSLGVLLFELTTGTRLFRGPADSTLAEQVAAARIPAPSSRLPGYPPELEKIVLRALARDRRDRQQTAQELELAIEEFARENRVALSFVSLATFMQQIFPREAAEGPLTATASDRATNAATGTSGTLAASGASPHEHRRRHSTLARGLIAAAMLFAGLAIVFAARRSAPPEARTQSTHPPSLTSDQAPAQPPVPSPSLTGSRAPPPEGSGSSTTATTSAGGSAPDPASTRFTRSPRSRRPARLEKLQAEPLASALPTRRLGQAGASWTLDSPLPP